jgi:hypothetical protein
VGCVTTVGAAVWRFAPHGPTSKLPPEKRERIVDHLVLYCTDHRVFITVYLHGPTLFVGTVRGKAEQETYSSRVWYI